MFSDFQIKPPKGLDPWEVLLVYEHTALEVLLVYEHTALLIVLVSEEASEHTRSVNPQLHQMLKKYVYLFLQRFLLHIYISIPKLYLVLLSRDLKDQKVGYTHPPSTIHHPLNKTKIFGVESEIQ